MTYIYIYIYIYIYMYTMFIYICKYYKNYIGENVYESGNQTLPLS